MVIEYVQIEINTLFCNVVFGIVVIPYSRILQSGSFVIHVEVESEFIILALFFRKTATVVDSVFVEFELELEGIFTVGYQSQFFGIKL